MCILITTKVISDITFLTADSNVCQNLPPLKIYFDAFTKEGSEGKATNECF